MCLTNNVHLTTFSMVAIVIMLNNLTYRGCKLMAQKQEKFVWMEITFILYWESHAQ